MRHWTPITPEQDHQAADIIRKLKFFFKLQQELELIGTTNTRLKSSMALLQIAEPGQSAAPHQHKLAAGIDLGTTNSLVATVRSGEAKTLFNKAGQDMLPSVVRYTNDSVIVGHAAAADAVLRPAQYHQSRSNV